LVAKSKSDPATVGVGVMKAPSAAVSELALNGATERSASGAQSPDSLSTIVLTIGDNKDVTLERVKAVTTPEGSTWRGIVQETGESALLMWWKDGRMSGVLGYKGHIYTVVNMGGEVHAVIEVDPRMMPPDHANPSAKERDSIAARSDAKPAGEDAKPAGPRIPEIKPLSDDERKALEAKDITIDLMLLYTKRSSGHYLRDPVDLLAVAIEQVNQSFVNSGVGSVKVRLVHTQEVDYDERDGEHFTHLYRMVDGLGPFKDVRRLRNEKKADIVGLIVDDASGCGLSTRVGADAEDAYFVVHHSCAAITISIAHEIGHILGTRHDRVVDALNTPFAYGHGFVNATKWRTMMSYQASCEGCVRIPYWSNPRVQYKGEPTGTLAADNARVILEQAERVSRFR
jgi:hypothetical protein